MDFSLFAFNEHEPWGRCLTSFLRSLFGRSNSEETVTSYQRFLVQFFSGSVEGGACKRPEDYTREDIEAYIHHRGDKLRTRSADGSPSISTVNARLTALSSFYNYAATFTIADAEGHPTPILQRPAPTIGIAHGRPGRVYKALTEKELLRFFAVIPDTPVGLRDRAIFLTFFYTSRRSAEIRRLRIGDIQEALLLDAEGKQHRGWTYRFFGKGKSTEADYAELAAPAKAAIDRYLAACGRGTLESIDPDQPLWIAVAQPKGGNVHKGEIRMISENGIVDRLKQYARLAGIDERFSLHGFRHTSSRMRYELGSDIREIQRLLRHQSLATTDLYLRALSGASDPGSRLLEDKFGEF